MNILILVVGIIIVLIIANKINKRGITMVNAQQARDLIKDSTTVVLDVRSTQEFAQGHIQGARLIPVSEIDTRISELADLKDRPILVYCHAGSRSSTASRILLKNGFKKVSNLQGGITAWSGHGGAIVKGK